MFHINLKKQRQLSGLSQKQIADYLQITPQSISKWENGDALPSLEYLPKLAECLRCDINAFFAPVKEQAIDHHVLYDFYVLLNEVLYFDTKEKEEIFAFEEQHPSSIVAMMDFFDTLRKRKTITPKTLQAILNCSAKEAQCFIEEMTRSELLEKLDIDNTYLISNGGIFGSLILLGCYQTQYEELSNPNLDFVATFMEKIDVIKAKWKN